MIPAFARIDYGYEQRLIDRIALKQMVRALPQRQKDVILRRYVYEETLEEVGKRHGVTRERIRCIEVDALKRLQAYAKRRSPLPQPAPSPSPKPASPRSNKKPVNNKQIFDRELRSLHEAIRNLVPPVQLPPPPVQRILPPPPSPTAWTPTPGYLEMMAKHAHTLLLIMRKPAAGGEPSIRRGSTALGAMCSGVRYPRVGGDLTRAMEALANEIPLHAKLSACPLAVSPSLGNANYTDPELSVRATFDRCSDQLLFHVTWDNG